MRFVTLADAPSMTSEKVMRNVDIRDAGCWTWKGYINRQGYGVFVRGSFHMFAHRAVYETLVGSIPRGLTLDHLCRNRACVRPSHLEPVTLKENIHRGSGVAPKNARKTHCPKGHPLVPTTNKPRRECPICDGARRKAYRERNLKQVGRAFPQATAKELQEMNLVTRNLR